MKCNNVITKFHLLALAKIQSEHDSPGWFIYTGSYTVKGGQLQIRNYSLIPDTHKLMLPFEINE